MSAASEAKKAGVDPELLKLLVCVVARELRDGEVVAFGLHAELLLAAACLAQSRQAPNLVIRHGLRVERGAPIGPAAWSDDRRLRTRGQFEYLEAHDAILEVANPASPQRFCDVFFVGGMQIDREGSTNLIGIKGSDGRLAVRGPGSIGTTSIGTLARHVILFSMEHSVRRFVERVDYVSVPGWKRRQSAGLDGGPVLCITPLSVMEFQDGLMRVRSVHPHATLAEVRSRTGFPLGPDAPVPVTPSPSREERAALERIDPFGRLGRGEEPFR